ncbi:hypothetical protein F7R91_32685 [Streptomyces luteolifulvus]|uniref:Uncharacterized protein n=2 Tax=Streptomyces luteolifulvus TaxID=2615112 RepID=A0A6H9US99_9ACTN|nr:hypothetical protein F7R91_32685 [Streptomyces luteolifulvus]
MRTPRRPARHRGTAMIPPAAVAIVRAAVEITLGNGLRSAGDMAEQVVEELTAMGWTITLDEPDDDRPAAA